jgi:hypothetical protein
VTSSEVGATYLLLLILDLAQNSKMCVSQDSGMLRPTKKAKSAPTPGSGRQPYTTFFNERFDVAKARYIARHYNDFPELRQGNGRESLLAILNRGRGRDGVLHRVEYQQRDYAYGRMYARGASLQRLNKVLLHTIASDLYDDIDMINAYPVIISQYLEAQATTAPALTTYVNHREQCLAELSQTTGLAREDCKELVHTVLSGGKGEHWGRTKDKLPRWLSNLIKEVQTVIHPAIADFEPEIWAGAKSARDKADGYDSVGGRAYSRVCQKIEHQGLVAMIDKCKELNVITDCCIPQFDGVKIPRVESGLRDSLLGQLETAITEQAGYRIKLAFKPVDKGLTLPGDLTPRFDGLSTPIEDGDNHAADVFYEVVRNDVRVCSSESFVKKGGTWIGDCSDREAVNRFLLDKCTRANLVKVVVSGDGKDGLKIKEVPYSSEVSNAKRIIELAKARVEEDPDFHDRLWWSPKGKLLFKNGYWDFANRCFVYGFDGVDSPIQIKRDFPPRNDAVIEEVYRRIFYPIFNEGNPELSVYLCFTARAAAGHVQDKRFAMIITLRDSGKSVLADYFEAALAPCATTNFTTSSLQVSPFGGSGDPIKDNWYTTPLEHTRLAFAQDFEIDASKDARSAPRLCGKKMKVLTSGGDPVPARGNYFKKIRTYKPSSTTVLCGNDAPPCTVPDVYENVFPFHFPNKFVTKEELEASGGDPTVKLRDDNIKEWCQRPEVTAALLHILFDSYQMCASMKERKETVLVNSGRGGLGDFLEVTGFESDFVTKDRVEEIIKGLNVSLDKFKIEVETRTRKLLKRQLLPFSVHDSTRSSRSNGRKRIYTYRGVRLYDGVGTSCSASVAGFVP